MRRILDNGLVEGKNIAFVGTQGYIPYREWELANDSGATVITADAVKEQGVQETARQALAAAGRWMRVHIR